MEPSIGDQTSASVEDFGETFSTSTTPTPSTHSLSSDSDETLVGDESVQTRPRTLLDTLSNLVQAYITTADEIEKQIRSSYDCSLADPEPINDHVFTQMQSDLAFRVSPDTSTMERYRIRRMRESANDLHGRYRVSRNRLQEARTLQPKINGYRKVVESLCNATKMCIQESLDYISKEKNIPDRDTNIPEYEYPQDLVERWTKMFEAGQELDQFMLDNRWDQVYMQHEWLSQEHPLQDEEQKMDDTMTDYSETLSNNSKFDKMAGIIADLIRKESI